MEKRRQIELDLLRVIALCAVICVHALGMGADAVTKAGYQSTLSFFSCAVTWQVPIYVMISGRFFLDPERQVPPRKIWESIKRVGIAFVIWNVIYQLYYIASGEYTDLNWNGILSQAVAGPYHFWFLFMIAGLYAITPFLRKIAENKKSMEYYIVLFILFEFLTRYGADLPVIGPVVSEVLGKIGFHFALGFSGYYILGCYLYRYQIPDKWEFPLYGVAALFFCAAAVATLRGMWPEGADSEYYVRYLNPNIIVVSAAIYTLFVKRISRIRFSPGAARIIAALSERSFGVYLSHALILELIGLTGVTVGMTTPFIMVPLLVLVTLLLGALLLPAIKRIPVIGKRMA